MRGQPDRGIWEVAGTVTGDSQQAENDEKSTKSPDLISPDSRKVCCSRKRVKRNGDTRSDGTYWDCASCRAPGERVVEPGWAPLLPARNGRVVKAEEMNRGF